MDRQAGGPGLFTFQGFATHAVAISPTDVFLPMPQIATVSGEGVDVATIRKRRAGWEVQVRRHGYPLANKTLPTRSEALAWAAVIESQMVRGVFIDRSRAEHTTFGELLERYSREITVHKKGAVVEACRIKSLRRAPIAAMRLTHLTGQAIALWRDERHRHVSGSTVCRDLNLLSHVFNVARKASP
ncbi:MAG: Shufflon-specific DNA recombinase [Proteobacteria bacterium]|nr:Shufflon-specific DNA recombinase [Pseudomonadota bacterium]